MDSTNFLLVRSEHPHASYPGVLSIMPKIPVISVGIQIERTVSVSFDRNIRDHLSGGGPHILVGIFRPKFAVPFLTNRFFALIREFGRKI